MKRAKRHLVLRGSLSSSMVRVQVDDGPLRLRVYAAGRVVLLAWNVRDEELRQRVHHYSVTRVDAAGEARPLGPTSLRTYHWSDYDANIGERYTYTLEAWAGDGVAAPLCRIAASVVLPDPFVLRHGVFFNRGVAGSQAYETQFPQHEGPLLESSRDKEPERWQWLSRGLEEALFRFIEQAVDGSHALFVSAYELTYVPLLRLLKRKAEAGVHVLVTYDAKGKSNTAEAEATIAAVAFPQELLRPRRAAPSVISHNKFIVFVERDSPVCVWTGSTNFTAGGIFGQANVGHIIRDAVVSAQYLQYWRYLADDPAQAALRLLVERLTPLPVAVEPRCCIPLFAPRSDEQLLHFHAALLDRAQSCSLLTAAFGVHPLLDTTMQCNRSKALRFVLSESKKGLPKARHSQLRTAYGAVLSSPPRGMKPERVTGLNKHVSFVHTKVLVLDAFSDDPIVVSGSGNFSKASVCSNDENQVVIRGDVDVADAFTVEFWRLFEHHLFRSALLDATERHDWMMDDSLRNTMCPLGGAASQPLPAPIRIDTAQFVAAMDEWQRANAPLADTPTGALVTGTDGWLQITFGYSKKLVDDLKAAIPSALRQWNADAKVWRIDPDARDLAIAFAAANSFDISL